MFYRVDFECDDRDNLQAKLNDLYDYKDNISTKVLHRNRINLFCVLMEKLIKDQVIAAYDCALDIGCSAGVYSKIISDFGFRHVLGVDVVQEVVDKANDYFAFNAGDKCLEYKVIRAEELDTNKKYNFILCTEVIEHTDNPTKVIKNIKEMLAPQGIAVITLPNKISIPYLSLFLFYKLLNRHMSQSLAEHLNYPFYKSIKLFEDKNIEIVETSGTNLILGGVILRWSYKTPMFRIINKINFSLSRLWPLKYFTQFFFLVLRNEGTLHPSA